jgi:uncharacterized protein YecE (DUF72 family)
MTHLIRVGVGGWQFDEWRETFYPAGLSHSKELQYASRKFTAVEVNATYYSSFKPDTFAKWSAETPDDYVFSLKAHRFCTVRKTKEDMATSIGMFLGQGVATLGSKLGPINWQFPETRRFDGAYFRMFLSQLPKEKDKVQLRHALEVRGEGFDTPEFYDLLAQHGATVVYAEDDAFPRLLHKHAPFAVARLMQSQPDEPSGYPAKEIDRFAKLFKGWSKNRDVFAFFISGAKARNPLAAEALLAKLGLTPKMSAKADQLAVAKGAKAKPPKRKKAVAKRAVAGKTAVAKKARGPKKTPAKKK